MVILKLLILCLVLVLTEGSSGKGDHGRGGVYIPRHDAHLPWPNLTMFRALAKEARNESRTVLVKKTLSEAAGVYRNKTKGREMGLSNTVFISVISYPKAAHFYKVYFRNFLCYVHHYGYDLVVYVVHHEGDDSFEEIRSLEALGVRALPYPAERFWTLISNKRTAIFQGSTHSKYNGTKITFQEFGALPMLVPSLEVIEAGFNVVYFDVDIALIVDPVPYLIRGDADFVSSIESRVCRERYLGTVPTQVDWERVEPNTGIMHLRATRQNVNFVRLWLEKVVDGNFVNDQRALSRRILNATYVPNCLPDGIKELESWTKRPTSTIRKDPDAPTYCLLSDIVFQNGMVGMTCQQTKKGNRDNWLLSTREYGVRVGESSFPVTLHVNFCNSKTDELIRRNLWLYQDGAASPTNSSALNQWGCRAYDLGETYYNKGMNWTAEADAIQGRHREILKYVLKNGTMIKSEKQHEIFMVWGDDAKPDSLVKRSFPDGDTFINLGFDFDTHRPHEISEILMDKIPTGRPFPSTLDWSKNTDFVKARKKILEDAKDYTPFWTPNLPAVGRMI